MKSVYLLTGTPGTGKTSLIRQALTDCEINAGGFYTEEIRSQGTRVGFRLVTLDSREAVLSHIDFDKRFRVGKYGVDIDALNRVGVAALQKAASRCDLIIIDEIGKMELLSFEFRNVVRDLIESNRKILGTIMLHADPRADVFKNLPQVNLVTLTRSNYNLVLENVRKWLTTVKSPAV